MKDITVLLLHYADYSSFYKVIHSLKQIKARIKSIILFQYEGQSIKDHYDLLSQIKYVDSEKSLHEIIQRLNTSYVLFLQGTDYLSATLNVEQLRIPHSKAVLETCFQSRDHVHYRPLLVRTSYLKQNKLFSISDLPFKEAILPAWLFTVDPSLRLTKEVSFVKQFRKSYSPNRLEREKFIQKYQFHKATTTNPSISVMISNYNMGKYVSTAIVSCLLQNEQFEQVFIMDDGSTDHSYQQVKRWHDGDHISVFRKKNEGKAKALNQLLPYITSDYVLELDADDWLDPDAVFSIKSFLSALPNNVAVLYGNLRKWKQKTNDVLLKGISKGIEVYGTDDLLSYPFPLGPRIYRTSILKSEGGFPVIKFADGRMYEDVSMLVHLSKKYQLCYHDFTVYNVREHNNSITKKHGAKWDDFLAILKET